MIAILRRDLASAWSLLSRHWLPVSVVVIATLMMILMESPRLRPSVGARHWDALLYYGLIPLLTLVVFTRRSPLRLGLGLGDWRFWLPVSLLYLLIALPITLLGSSSAQMGQYYRAAGFDWTTYIWTTSVYMLGWEYLFRGYLLEGLRDSLKEGAILLQMIPFTLLHLGKPDIETLSCVISGIIWGYICYRGRSFWPAFLLHMVINLTTKAYTNGAI